MNIAVELFLSVFSIIMCIVILSIGVSKIISTIRGEG